MSEQAVMSDFGSQLDALRTVERRRLLHALSTERSDGEASADIAQFVSDDGAPDPAVSMWHVHLPKLESMGYVRVDRESERVVTGPNFDRIEPLVQLLDDNADAFPAEWL